MEFYKSYNYNKEITTTFCDNIITIIELFKGSVDTTKLEDLSIPTLILVSDVRYPVNDDIMCYLMVTVDNAYNVTIKHVFTFYDKEEDYTSSLTNQLNRNLLLLYDYYNNILGEDYSINHKRINRYLSRHIHEELKIDLRRRR